MESVGGSANINQPSIWPYDGHMLLVWHKKYCPFRQHVMDIKAVGLWSIKYCIRTNDLYFYERKYVYT